MAKGIFEATFTHSKNLAMFVFLYKSLTSLMSWLQSDKIQFHSFAAAFIGGYLVFGRYNKVNEQVGILHVINLSTSLSTKKESVENMTNCKIRNYCMNLLF